MNNPHKNVTILSGSLVLSALFPSIFFPILCFAVSIILGRILFMLQQKHPENPIFLATLALVGLASGTLITTGPLDVKYWLLGIFTGFALYPVLGKVRLKKPR